MRRFVIYTDRKGKWRWRLVSSNGKIIADSGESYANKWNVVRSAERMCKVIRTQVVVIVEATP